MSNETNAAAVLPITPEKKVCFGTWAEDKAKPELIETWGEDTSYFLVRTPHNSRVVCVAGSGKPEDYSYALGKSITLQPNEAGNSLPRVQYGAVLAIGYGREAGSILSKSRRVFVMK
jgi:hypothetical protein